MPASLRFHLPNKSGEAPPFSSCLAAFDSANQALRQKGAPCLSDPGKHSQPYFSDDLCSALNGCWVLVYVYG